MEENREALIQSGAHHTVYRTSSAKRKAQTILDVLSSIFSTRMMCDRRCDVCQARRAGLIQRFPKYQLRYTRLFEQDLMRAAQYIDQVLDNPTAAQKLVDDTEKAILERLNFAESFEPYPSTKQREYPYYRIYVHNCTVFYVVIDGVMEVRRFLYSAQDIPRML